MPYQEILSRAWQIFRRQRALWLFGFLSACTGGVYGRLSLPSFNFQVPNDIFQQPQPHRGGAPPSVPPEIADQMQQWAHYLANISENTIALIALGIFALVMLWFLVALALRVVAEPSLVRGILADIETGEPLSVGEAFRHGKPFLGRTLLFYLLLGGTWLVSMVVLAVSVVALALATAGIGILCLVPFFLLLIPLAWLLELYLVLVYLALVLEDTPLLASFGRGWEVLKSNFWHAVLMGLLLTVIRWGVSIAVGVVVVFLAIPTLGGVVLVGIATHGSALLPLIVIGVLILTVLVLIAAFLMGMLQVYLQSAWVLTYRHFVGQPPVQENGEPQPAGVLPPEAAPPADADPAPEAP